ncbi:MAG: phytoene/squalene synthase family protein [Chthoniobacteraceae bacterium]
MKRAQLRGPVLRSVSRSFYLTIRMLPGALRQPVGLAYLLARASDTIADAPGAPVSSRSEHLAAFRQMIRQGNTHGLSALQFAINSPHPGETTLIRNLDTCLEMLRAQPEFDRAAIQAVMEKIIHGQAGDLDWFGHADSVRALPDAAVLERYTYHVAGSVGEFWTELCAHHLPNYSRLPLAELAALGVDFGKGLQLVNILRDLPADLRDGRCYLPASELPPDLLATAEKAQPVFDHWRERAGELLEAGRRYIRAIRPARVRAGCFLPWYLGVKTLDLLRERSPLLADEKIKVSRATVRAGLFRAALAAFSDGPLEGPKPAPQP